MSEPAPALPSRFVPAAPLPLPPIETSRDPRQVIESLERELIACQRLALLGSLTAMVTHEFNNLLTPIMARSEAALSSPEDLPFMRKTLERALSQSQRAMTVTRHLLDLAHDRRPIEQSCSVLKSVREALDTLTRPLEKDGIALQLAVPEDLQIRAQEDLFCQVLLNLLLNARKAMQGRSGRLSITATANRTHAHIAVKDSGKGIPFEVLETVFNPFLAADPFAKPNDWQAVGLGLSVCRMIAHQHGARLHAEANPEGGCTFRLDWPLADHRPIANA